MAFVPKTGVASGRDNGVIDVYRGRTVLKAGGWREAFISPGLVTLAGNL